MDRIILFDSIDINSKLYVIALCLICATLLLIACGIFLRVMSKKNEEVICNWIIFNEFMTELEKGNKEDYDQIIKKYEELLKCNKGNFNSEAHKLTFHKMVRIIKLIEK